MSNVHITQIGDAPCDCHLPFTIRGKNKGEKAKPTECCVCKDEIAVGEQYFRVDGWRHVCLGCAKYS